MATFDEKRQHNVAVHEAGHAVMAHLLGMKVNQLVVDFGNEKTRGYVDWDYIDASLLDESKRKDLIDVFVNLAGMEAEKLIIGRLYEGWLGDMDSTMKIIDRRTVGKEPDADSRYITRAGGFVKRALEPHVSILRTIADRLLQSGSISREEFLVIMEGLDQ